MGILPKCKDPAISALKNRGWSVVQTPRVDLHPTQLLVRRDKKLQRLGELATVFVPDPQAPVPVIKPDQPGPNIGGTKSSDIDIGVGLNILGGLISALGGSTLGLSLGYSRARSVQFEYADTIENSAELALIDQFLGASSIHPFAQAARQMLEADDVFVVTATLKASKIKVAAKDSSKNALSVDVPVIQGAVGGNLKVSAGGSGTSLLTYEGKVPLVFGFQAVQLIFDGGRFRSMKLTEAGDYAAEALATGEAQGADSPLYASPEVMLSTDL